MQAPAMSTKEVTILMQPFIVLPKSATYSITKDSYHDKMDAYLPPRTPPVEFCACKSVPVSVSVNRLISLFTSLTREIPCKEQNINY